MMTKAAFFMQEHLRRNYAYISDLPAPNAFFCRGRLPFPQGLTAIGILFHDKVPADIYAHRYFVEKQSDPNQPSPQMHITEELQGMRKVLNGLRFMKDDQSKLDDTVGIVTDYDVPAKGRLLYAKTEHEVELEQQEEREKMFKEKSHGAAGPHVDRGDAAAAAAAGQQPRGGFRLWDKAVASDIVREGGGALPHTRRRSTEETSARRVPHAFRHTTSSSTSGFSPASTAPLPTGAASPLFPTALETVKDQEASYAFFRGIQVEQQDRARSTSPLPAPQVTLHEQGTDAPGKELFHERVGGHTIVYNPIEVNERTFAELTAKMNEEMRVVQAIVVPTRHAWRQVQLWADAFPDAAIISSGPLSIRREDGSITTTAALAKERAAAAASGVTGSSSSSRAPSSPSAAAACSPSGHAGMQDFGHGIVGMTFPEVDLEAESVVAAAANDAAAQAAQTARVRAERAAPSAPAAVAPPASTDERPRSEPAVAGMSRRQLAMREERARRAALPRPPDTEAGDSSSSSRNSSADPVDLLWSPQAAAIIASAGYSAGESEFGEEGRVGALREADAGRVRDLSQEGSPAVVELTPSILLIRVRGDAMTDEYVLYDRTSRSLFCTDLFHGAYADLDSVNSWMCRVWFKFMKRGNYKRIDIVPRFKWRQVCGQGTLRELQTFVDWLTRSFDIQYLIHSHGTPPYIDGAANALREQWDLQPLHPSELPCKHAVPQQRR